MRKKDLALRRVQHHSGAELPLDAIEFLTTYPGREPQAEILESTTVLEKYQSPKLRQIYLRNNHNELEKSRRAQLKGCLETLSEVVPMGNDTKQTTLGLLTRSRRYIKYLEEREKDHLAMKEELILEQKQLRSRLEELQNFPPSEDVEIEYTTMNLMQESEDSMLDLSYVDKLEEISSDDYDDQIPHILKDKGYEVASEAIGKEINLADAEGYCLLLDDIDMLENFKYDPELGKIIIHGQLRREDHDEVDLVELII